MVDLWFYGGLMIWVKRVDLFVRGVEWVYECVIGVWDGWFVFGDGCVLDVVNVVWVIGFW